MAHTHKLVDGVKIDLTAEEISELNAKDEIENKKIADAKIIYDNNKYQRDREAEYLSTLGNWQDQLDMIYHDIDAWKAKIKKIKDDNPKG
tara:strand:+ start:714 stop:983 length:270 start_codon:yes stop_codon:yes gene_type:complete